MKNRFPTQRGFSLVELMIALVLGLFLTGVTINVVIANRQAFRTTENLSRMQENARTAFELMARDIRVAGGNPCGTSNVVNVLNNPAANWWANWAAGSVIGYENGIAPAGYGNPVQNAPLFAAITGANNQPPTPPVIPPPMTPNTDGILLLSGNAIEGLMISDHNPTSAQFQVNIQQNHGVATNDIVMACDYQSAAIFQVSNANQNNPTIVHNTGAGAPGNCTKGLGSPLQCTANGTPKTFEEGGFLVRFSATFWYVGANARGGSSLFRVTMNGSPTAIRADEIVDNVCPPGQGGCQGLQITYLTRNKLANGVLANGYVNGNAGIDWSSTATQEVAAVRISLDLQSRENTGINAANQAAPLITNLSENIYLRNREFAQ